MTLKLIRATGPPMDLLQAMIALAAEARSAGWVVNVALESGEGERMTFSAARGVPDGVDVG